MKRKEIEADQMPGQDSFLDVVTNIVGVLILLVLVVGLRSSRAVATSLNSDAAAAQAQQLADEVHQARSTAANTERNVRDLVRRTVTSHGETVLREQERVWLTSAVTEAEGVIAARRARLNEQDQRDFDLRRQLKEAQLKLDDLARQQVALMAREPESEEIQCAPTPLGKVVTGAEVHLMLSDDHIAIIPFEELIELMKTDARANIWRLRDQDEMERTIGPIKDFRMTYLFVKSAIVARNQQGATVAGTFPRFARCYFLPLTTPSGEPAEEALQPESELGRYLRQLRPDTTVTVWVYPTNYDRLRELKGTIREYGLQVAVRPLPAGMPIGASSNGTESISE